jgi:hypothetical protein
MDVIWENPYFCVGIGNVIAAILAWKRNKDLGWSVIGFLLGWLYVFYWFFTMDDYDDE